MEPTSQDIPTVSIPIPTLTPPPIEIVKPKYWKRRLFASIGFFILAMGLFQIVTILTKTGWTKNILTGAIVLSLGAAILFYLVYWVISIIGRKFGNRYAVIIWILLVGGLLGWHGVWLYKTVHATSNQEGGTLQEDSLALPPGTDLSEFPSYIEIDKSRITNLPGGGMMIPKSAIKFVMTYDECLKTADVTAQKLCANKYSVEKKDVNLCKTMLPLGNVSAAEDKDGILPMQQECIGTYAIVHKDPALCNSLESKYMADSCFGGIVDQVKDAGECKVVFKTDMDIKDCVTDVAKNEEMRKEKEQQKAAK